MNIFQYLGQSADHRKENKVTQLVKHFDEVTEKNKKGKKFAVQTKKDGVCSIVLIIDGTPTIWSRTGKQFTNTERITHKISMCNFNDGVYLGEMLLPKEVGSLEELSGMVNPNRSEPLSAEREVKKRLIEMHLFDCLTLAEFISGYSPKSFKDRYETLISEFSLGVPIEDVKLVLTNYVDTENAIDLLLETNVKNGEEGIVIRDSEADWEAGHKGYRVMKKVRGVDYDLLCVGYEEGTGKYAGKVANLIFKWKGDERIKCMLGKGWSHLDAEYMFNDIKCNRENTPIGKIFQVYALEESSKGKLRLAKVGELRHDKDTSDV